MDILFSNNAKTLLDGAILIGATSLVVDSATNFPNPTGGQYFYATLQNPADDMDFEIVKVTAVSGNTFTIVREQEGTDAQAWGDGTLCELRMTKESMEAIKKHAGDHLSGGSSEIDGDKIDIDWNPSFYVPAVTPTEVDSVDHLVAHLYGLDQMVKAASQDARGTIELATMVEAKAGSETGMAITPSTLAGVLKQQSWMQEDGYYIGTDKVRARDGDGLDLEDDGGNGLHIADGGAVSVDALTASKLVASDGSKKLVSVEPTIFETGGSQEIDGDKLDVDFTPSNYTPASTPAEADNVDNLAAHLYGLDQALAIRAPEYLTIPIPAGAMYATATDGAEAGNTEKSTNKINLDHWAFDAGATEKKVQFLIPAMPENWDRGTVKVYFLWASASGSSIGDKVTWAVKAGAFSNDDAIDAALGTPQAVEDTLLAADGGDWQMSGVTPALTIGGSPALRDAIVFEIFRDTDGSIATTTDDMAEDAWLYGAVVQIKLSETVTPQ